MELREGHGGLGGVEFGQENVKQLTVYLVSAAGILSRERHRSGLRFRVVSDS